MDCKEFSCFLSGLSGCELVAIAGILAVAISSNLSCDETATLGTFFTALGDNLALISAANDNSNC